MGFVQGLSLAALAFILTSQMFRAMNPTLEEAARVHGMAYTRIIRRITLPLALPGILAAVIYIFTIGIATFDIPAILGLGNRVYMLSSFIYLKVHPQGAGLPDYGITGVVGAFMIVVAGFLTLWYSQILRQGHRFEVVTGKGYGATNFIAMDRSGEVLVDRVIQVEGPTDQLVTVYRGVERESYSCMPTCQRRITLGDGENYFKSAMDQAGSLNSQATGNAAAAAKTN